jgi:hypothetical protein
VSQEWATPYYLNYKGLKKIIKVDTPQKEHLDQVKKLFFFKIEREVEKVNDLLKRLMNFTYRKRQNSSKGWKHFYKNHQVLRTTLGKDLYNFNWIWQSFKYLVILSRNLFKLMRLGLGRS